MNSLQIALRVLRIDRRTRTSAILTAVGVAVATALVSLLVSLPFATDARAERAAWQQPGYADSGGAGIEAAVSHDYVNGQEITKVDVAALRDDAKAQLPPGIPKFPEPGEVLLSPALSDLIQEQPETRLGDRFPGTGVGRLGDEALTSPEQLVALVGQDRGSLGPTATKLPNLASGSAMPDPLLGLLAGVGIVVLLVPSLVLVASASRLTAARRERRLAALRLAGATPSQVVNSVATETALAAGAGAVLGLLIGWPLHAVVRYVPWDGGTWQAGDFALPAWLALVIAITIPALVVLAAALGLRRVVSAPLGAAAAHRRKAPKAWRLLAIPAAGLAFAYGLGVAQDDGGLAVMLGGLALVVLSASVVGPWVTAAVGGIFVRVWRRPAMLLAGRRLRDDPKAAYRASAGVVLAVFTGSMALMLLPSFESMAGGGRSFQDSVLYVETDAAHAKQVMRQANDKLAEYGQQVQATTAGQVSLSGSDGSLVEEALVMDCSSAAELTRLDLADSCSRQPGVWSTVPLSGTLTATSYGPTGAQQASLPEGTQVHPAQAADTDVSGTAVVSPSLVPERLTASETTVLVPTTPDNREVVRTALVGASGGAQVESRELLLHDQQTQLGDLRRVTVIGLLSATGLAGASAAISAAGAVLDRRRTFGSLMAAGTPLRVLARALRTEAALPALVATVGAGTGGVFVGLALLGLIEGTVPTLTPWVLAPVALGMLVALLAASASAPALRRVRAEPLSDE